MFLICLLLAFAFWMLNVLAKSYVTVIYVPVEYENFPTDRVVMNKLPERLAARASVSGYSLLIQGLKKPSDTVKVNGDYLQEKVKGGVRLSYLHVKPLLNELTSSSHENFHIKEILIDTLFIQFDKKVVKTLPIKSQIAVNLAKQCVFSGEIQFVPSHIKVAGPKSIVDTMKYIYTDSLFIGEIEADYATSISFSKYINNKRYSLSPKAALVNIGVEKLTEATVEIPIDQKNVPSKVALKTFPDKAKVVYLVPISKFNLVDKEDFKLLVDYSEIKEGSLKLHVRLTKSPTFVTISRVEPSKVEYILKKK